MPFSRTTRVHALAAAMALALAASSCHGNGAEISIVSYNVHNLFDAFDAGTEYAEFSVAEGSWDEARYRERLGLAADAIKRISREGGAGPSPDVVALAEIENGDVARDLASLLGPGYASAAAPASGSATTVGIITRLPIAGLRAHATLSPPSGSPARPILEAELQAEGGALVIFVNHWKSRKEGRAETEPDRVVQAEALSAAIVERALSMPEAAIIACGDFNEDPEAFAASPPEFRTALALDSAGGGTGAEASPIVLGPGERAAGGDCGPRLRLASSWLMPGDKTAGSYAFRGAWERIDAFLLGPSLLDGRGIEYLSFPAAAPPALLSETGFPRPWSMSDRGGYSDHLPILLRLRSLPPAGPGVQ
jgi:hypothetical protein